MQSNSSDKYVHRYIIKILNLFYSELQQINTKPIIQGPLSGLVQLMLTKNPIKMMKNAFCFTSKAISVLKIFKFLSWLFCQLTKQLD